MQQAGDIVYETPLKTGDPAVRSPKLIMSEPHSPKPTSLKKDLWGVMRSPMPQSPAPAHMQSQSPAVSSTMPSLPFEGFSLEPHTPRDIGSRSIFGVEFPTPGKPRAPPASPMEMTDFDSCITPGKVAGNSGRTTAASDHAEPEGLVLDFHGKDYSGNRVWVNRVANYPDAYVPETIKYDDAEKAFVFSPGGDVITVPLATNGNAMRDVTYCTWVKVPDDMPMGNLGWVITQCPDYAWSRALTLNDYRLGHVSITSAGYWDSQLGRLPPRRWCHVVGVWRQSGSSTVYLNGNRGGTVTAKNGRGSDPAEVLAIGGRGPGDRVHNPLVSISRVSVYDRALSDTEVAQLFNSGRDAFDGVSLPALDQLSPHILRQMAAAQEPPQWDEATGRFWCATGVSLQDLPDGLEWQREFKNKLDSAASSQPSQPVGVPAEKPQRRVLRVQVSDVQANAQQSQQRLLARHPSDPEKRATRAAYSSALKQMSRRAGTSLLVHGKRLALFRFQQRVFAVAAECPHQGGALVEGEIGDIEDMVDGRKCYVTCPVHKFQFDLSSGAVLDGRCGPLPTYAARIVRGSVDDDAAMIEVGFESLAEDYFHEFECDDF